MHFGTQSAPEYDKTVHGGNKREFSKKLSVAGNFCCEDMSVHNRKDIAFEGEGDKLLPLAYSTSSPFILLLM